MIRTGSAPRRTPVGLVVLAALCVVVLPATTAAARTSKVRIGGAWARTTPPGATNGVLYLRIISDRNDALVSVTVPPDVAQRAELHATMGSANSGGSMANMPGMSGDGSGMMTMQTLQSVRLRAGRPITFEPGGKHIMLIGLAHPLEVGQKIAATLQFRRAPAQVVTFTVRDNPPPASR